MNQGQARRLLDIGVTCVARYDSQGQRTAAWADDPAPCWSHLLAADTAAWRVHQRAAWVARTGLSAELSRLIAVDSLSGLLTILVPMPGGGFVVAVVERWLVRTTAEALADELEAAVQREFGPQVAPYVVAAVAVAALVLVIAAIKSGE